MVYRTFGMVHLFSILDFLSVTDLLTKVFCPFSVPPEGENAGLSRIVCTLFEHWQGLRVLQSNILNCVLCVDLRKTKNTSFLLRALLHTLSRAISPTPTDQFQSRIISPTAPHQDYIALLSVLSRQFFATSAILFLRLTPIPY